MLKDLRVLVDAETHRSIEALSVRVGTILEEIRLRDRFAFGRADLAKKAVTVQGSFSQGLKIDAAMVANSSWLRAILWAFIFALREQTIADQGANHFPLMVLDDPQLTFDPKNKRKWAEKIVALANDDPADPNGMQLFLMTHERQFFDILCETEGLHGQKGAIAGPTVSTGVTHIANGTALERQYQKAMSEESDLEGFHYVRDVRVYCEDLLRIMLRPESYDLTANNLGALCTLLSTLRNDHVPPFNRRPFIDLAKALSEQSNKAVKVINATHHTFDGTIGLTQAEDVERYWSENLERRFDSVFRLAADFDAFGGDARLFPWAEKLVDFPPTQSDAVAALNLYQTGIAAAASTDGQIGDGVIELEEWTNASSLKLHNHSAYRLTARTLEPVVSIGDIILVKNYGQTNPRNLVVAVYGDQLFARRFSETETHPDLAVLTGQATDPYSLPSPVIAPKDKVDLRKIVGTVFMANYHPPASSSLDEFAAVENISLLQARLEGARLFQVKGRSMEPIALEDQFVMTHDETVVDPRAIPEFG